MAQLILGLTLMMPTPVIAAALQSSSSTQSYQQALKHKKEQRCDLALPYFEAAMRAIHNGFDSALELKILRHRGECYQYQGDYALAWLDLSYGRCLLPEDALFYEALGWLAIFTGDYSIAQGHLEHAQHLSPDNPWVKLNLGWAYYFQGQTQRAAKLWMPLLQSPQPTYRQALQQEIQLLQVAHQTQGLIRVSFDGVSKLLKEMNPPQ